MCCVFCSVIVGVDNTFETAPHDQHGAVRNNELEHQEEFKDSQFRFKTVCYMKTTFKGTKMSTMQWM